MKTYRVFGLASTHVHTLVEARSRAEARNKAADVAAIDWTEEACGVPADVTISFVEPESRKRGQS